MPKAEREEKERRKAERIRQITAATQERLAKAGIPSPSKVDWATVVEQNDQRVVVWDQAVAWVISVRYPTKADSGAKDETEWFGAVAEWALDTVWKLRQWDEEGRFKGPFDSSSAVVRLPLLTQMQLFLAIERGGFSWGNALEEYVRPWWWKGDPPSARNLAKPGRGSLAASVAGLRAELEQLLTTFGSESHPARVGELLSSILVATSQVMIAIEVELRPIGL